MQVSGLGLKLSCLFRRSDFYISIIGIISGMRRPFRLQSITASLILLLLALLPAGALAANLSHSYQANTSLPKGSLVTLSRESSNNVELASTSNGTRLIGVVVDSNDSLLAVNSGEGKVQAATSGTANALVSTLNGDIKPGDQISVSQLAGIGMKAGPNMRLIGLAQSKLNDSTPNTNKLAVTGADGRPKVLRVGYVRVTIDVGTSADVNGGQLTSLQRFVKAITGHVISTPRIIASLVIAVLALVSLGVLLYASIYGSIISIGRNPLAQGAVMRTLRSVIAIAVLIAGVAFTSIFFLLH
jgi:hypothetical protein